MAKNLKGKMQTDEALKILNLDNNIAKIDVKLLEEVYSKLQYTSTANPICTLVIIIFTKL